MRHLGFEGHRKDACHGCSYRSFGPSTLVDMLLSLKVGQGYAQKLGLGTAINHCGRVNLTHATSDRHTAI